MCRRSANAGFSLVELLLVVAVILVISAIAIPNYLQAKIRANEAVAVANMRTIVSAQALYSTMFPQIGYAPDVRSLGSDGSNSALPSAAGLVGNELSVAAHGYLLTIATHSNGAVNTSFTVYGHPTAPGMTGKRGFCADESGVITYSADGSSNCSAPIPF
jgi:type IV pilus assembly protein PilA